MRIFFSCVLNFFMVLCFRCCLIWAIKKSFRWSRVGSVSLQVGSHPRGGRFFCREDVHELHNFFFNSRKKSLERVIREGTFCVINALRSFLPNLNLCNYVFFLLLYFFFFLRRTCFCTWSLASCFVLWKSYATRLPKLSS